MTDILGLLRRLAAARVEFVIVGGVAANIHGALRTTLDLDVVYGRHPDNLERLAMALAPIAPYLRGAPSGLPFVLDVATLERGLNFTLTTSEGDLDLLGEVAGGGDFERLRSSADVVRLEGHDVLVVTLPALIGLKRAAGRGKDREALAELEALLEERGDAGR
ncbi:MAG: nucleotidyltransferase [Vicinamibacterales bacterium]